jgi:protein SCO1/2
LRTHEGKEVRFYDDLIHGKHVVINMMYADCQGLCPPMTANLVKVQQMLNDRVGKDIFIYSITLQPEMTSC